MARNVDNIGDNGDNYDLPPIRPPRGHGELAEIVLNDLAAKKVTEIVTPHITWLKTPVLAVFRYQNGRKLPGCIILKRCKSVEESFEEARKRIRGEAGHASPPNS